MTSRRSLLKGIGAAGAAFAAMPSLAESSADQQIDLTREGNRRMLTAEDKPRTLVLLLVDKSGSMSSRRDATIAGLNTYVEQLQSDPELSDLLLSILQFDQCENDKYVSITETRDLTPIASFTKLTRAEYVPRGGTPLWTAVANGIGRLERVVRPVDKVIMATNTDGMDTGGNPEITADVVKQMIEAKRALGNWTFVFMGADIDAWGVGSTVSMSRGNTIAYANNMAGISASYASTATATMNLARSSLRSTESFYSQSPPKVIAVDAEPAVVVPKAKRVFKRQKDWPTS